MTVEEIHSITKIDEWFLNKLRNIVEKELPHGFETSNDVSINKNDFALAKSNPCGENLLYPPRSFKMVDTCAGEFDAETPYFYSTTGGENEAEAFLQENI